MDQPIDSEQAKRDAISHLNILSIIYYIFGAIQCCVGLFPLIHMTMGSMFLIGGASSGSDDGAGIAAMGGFFLVLGGTLVFCLELLAVMFLMVGGGLKARKRYTLCYVVACLVLINFPLGTALGIFTIITLNKPVVKELFKQVAEGGPAE